MTRKVLLIFSLFISTVVTAQTITVYFDFNSFMLNNETRHILNKFIASGKATSVGFFGHTDQMGSTAYNEWLSVQRALAVRDYLVSKGLKQNNISVVRGFGAERLITDQPDSVSRQLNRRVTITNRYKPTPIDLAISSKQSAIHYTTSPDINKKDVEATSTVSIGSPAVNTAPQKLTETNVTIGKSSNAGIKQPVHAGEEKITTVPDSVRTIQEPTSQSDALVKIDNKQSRIADSVQAAQETISHTNAIADVQKNEIKVTDSADIISQKQAAINTDVVQKSVVDSANVKRLSVVQNQTTTNTGENGKFIIDSAEIKKQRVQQPTGAVKESFADKLSKAVNDPSIAKTPRTTNSKSSATNTNAPVVKQQKHEKLIEDIKDKSTKVGEHIVLRHIHFYGGRHAFLPQAYPALDDLLETMQKVPTLQIEIQGHICCQEGEGDQIDFDSGEPVLSVTRAKAVYDFLVENGIDKGRMSYVGLAHKFPIIKEEANEEEATINRRVEIKIIKK